MPQQGVQDVDVLGGQPVLDAQVVLQGTVHPGHHVTDHLGGGVPDAHLLSQAGSKASRKGS